MIAALLWIVGCYILAAAVIYALSAVRRRQARNVKHYVLIAGNEGQRMEWYMRSLRRFSHLTGTDVRVTVVDNGSEDETLRIARVFAKRGMDVQVHAGVESGEDGVEEPGQGKGQGQERRIGKEEAQSGLGRSAKWKRFRAIWQWRIGERDGSDAALGESGRKVKPSQPVEPTHLLWMLQTEGIVSAKEHAVLIDLRNPDDLSKLPF